MTEVSSYDADNQVVRRLQRKRAEVSGEIKETEALLLRLRSDLDALDGTLAILDPTKAAVHRRKPPPKVRHDAYKGEMQQLVLQALGDATKPITTLQVSEVVMTERALDWNDRTLVRAMRGRALCCLQRLRDQDIVSSKLLAPKLMVWWLASRSAS